MSRKKYKLPEIDFGDPFEDWTRRAYKFAKDLCLPVNFINEAKYIIINAFGEDWLRQEFKKKSPFDIPSGKHVIAQCFLTGGEPQIITIIELAIYLKALVRIPNINKVLVALHNNEQYESAFLQLSYAYRFLKWGATSLELEPPADGGRLADIYFKINEEAFLCECFCPMVSTPIDSTEELRNYASTKLFDLAKSKGKKLFFVLNTKSHILASDRKLIVTTCYNLIKRICLGETQQEADLSCCTVKIYDAGKIERASQQDYTSLINKLTNEADWRVDQCAVRKDDLEKVRDSLPVEQEEWCKIFVKRSAEETSSGSINEFGQKIESKISQLRREKDNPKGVIIVKSRLGITRDSKGDLTMQRIYRKILDKHENIAAVLLTKRVWLINQRYQYRTVLLSSREPCLFNDKNFLDKINHFEHKMDLLTDWQRSLGDIKPARKIKKGVWPSNTPLHGTSGTG